MNHSVVSVNLPTIIMLGYEHAIGEICNLLPKDLALDEKSVETNIKATAITLPRSPLGGSLAQEIKDRLSPETNLVIVANPWFDERRMCHIAECCPNRLVFLYDEEMSVTAFKALGRGYDGLRSETNFRQIRTEQCRKFSSQALFLSENQGLHRIYGIRSLEEQRRFVMGHIRTFFKAAQPLNPFGYAVTRQTLVTA